MLKSYNTKMRNLDNHLKFLLPVRLQYKNCYQSWHYGRGGGDKPLQLFPLSPQQNVCWYPSDLNKFITPTVMSALTTNSSLSSSRFARIRTNMNLFKVHWINSIQNSLRHFHTRQLLSSRTLLLTPGRAASRLCLYLGVSEWGDTGQDLVLKWLEN